MMAETIRDVIIKIRLQQEKTSLQPPDTSAFRQAISNAVSPGGTATAARATSAEKEAENALRLAERTAAYIDNIDATAGQTIVNRAQRNAAARAQADAAALAASRMTLESLNAVGEGALRAGRGIAFLTASTEDDLRASLQYVTAAQGTLDVFAGLSNATKGLLNARQVLTLSTVTSTGAETALGAALAVSPPVLAAVTVAALATAAAYSEITRQSREANKEIDLQSKYLNDAGRAWENYTERTERARSAISAAREDFSTAMDIIGRGSNVPGANVDDQIRAIRNNAQQARNDLDNRERRGELGAGLLGRQRADQEGTEIARREQEAILELREKQTQELQRQRDLARQALETAKQTVEAEKNRLASLEERIGRLSQGERNRLQGIAGKLGGGGQLTEADARFLDQTGVGGSQASAFFRQRGQAGGAGGILAGLGETAGLKSAQDNLRSTLASEGEALKEIETELANSLKSRQASYDKITQLLSEALTLKSLVQGLEKVVEAQGKNQTKTQLNQNQ